MAGAESEAESGAGEEPNLGLLCFIASRAMEPACFAARGAGRIRGLHASPRAGSSPVSGRTAPGSRTSPNRPGSPSRPPASSSISWSAAGYVHRTPDPTDARARLVQHRRAPAAAAAVAVAREVGGPGRGGVVPPPRCRGHPAAPRRPHPPPRGHRPLRRRRLTEDRVDLAHRLRSCPRPCPSSTSCSICSASAKRDVTVMRVPAGGLLELDPRRDRRHRRRSGCPTSSAKPSSNSSERGSSSARNRHQPRAFSPSGPVM